jgi:hypothetical protein
MYLIMVLKRVRTIFLLAGLLCAVHAPGLEQSLELGRDQLWREMGGYEGVVSVPGRWGFQDLTLAPGAYRPDGDTELLLHFDRTSEGDATGAWRYASSSTASPSAAAGPLIAEAAAAIGTGGAVFQSRGDGVALTGPSGSLFSPGSVWGDFTIEFWLHPATLANGETVLSWEGGVREDGGVAAQALRAVIRDRRLVWEARDLFTLPGGKRLTFTVTGIRQLLPRAWHHHLLRFDSRLGILEYALDGEVEAVIHTTDTGREKGSVAVPMIGSALPGPLTVGAKYTGFLDELRVSRRFVEAPSLARFPGRTGTAVSRLLDLGHPATRVVRIETVQSTPSDSAVFGYYRLSDALGRPASASSGAEAGWIPFAPGAGLPDTARGRWLQVMVELFPDGTRKLAPSLSSIRIVYEPHLAPLAPAGVTATPGNGKITVSWRRVDDPELKGYEVYYGFSPGSYFGEGAAQGASPLDAGNVTQLEITGLENGTLYYFAVAAYDGAEPRQRSVFSAEVGARPSRIHP